MSDLSQAIEKRARPGPATQDGVWHLGRKMMGSIPSSHQSWMLMARVSLLITSSSGIYPEMRLEPIVKTAHKQISVHMKETSTQNNSNNKKKNNPKKSLNRNRRSIKSKTQKILQV